MFKRINNQNSDLTDIIKQKGYRQDTSSISDKSIIARYTMTLVTETNDFESKYSILGYKFSKSGIILYILQYKY